MYRFFARVSVLDSKWNVRIIALANSVIWNNTFYELYISLQIFVTNYVAIGQLFLLSLKILVFCFSTFSLSLASVAFKWIDLDRLLIRAQYQPTLVLHHHAMKFHATISYFKFRYINVFAEHNSAHINCTFAPIWHIIPKVHENRLH